MGFSLLHLRDRARAEIAGEGDAAATDDEDLVLHNSIILHS